MATIWSDDPRDTIKMLRETLCVAQARIGNSPLYTDRRDEHVRRIARLIASCDEQRPLGTDGKHGDLHTPTCGCSDVTDEWGGGQ